MVKCVEVKDDWMRIPSGWIRIEEPGEYQYLVFPDYNESLKNNKDKLSNSIDGNTNYKTDIEGKYLIVNKENPSLDTAVLYKDGACLIRCKQAAVPVTDSNGYTDGWYIAKNDKIYIQFGGSIYGYECSINGDKLIFTEGKQIDTSK